jgi:hypothetical protein
MTARTHRSVVAAFPGGESRSVFRGVDSPDLRRLCALHDCTNVSIRLHTDGAKFDQ